MNCIFLSWNVRGLGKPEKQRAVNRVLVSSKVNIGMLQESKLETISPWVKRRLLSGNLKELASAPSLGASGGIITLWDPRCFTVEKCHVEERLIVVTGSLAKTKSKVGICNIYAPNDLGERRRFFEQLSGIIDTLGIPVILGGDFNSVLTNEERSGVRDCQASMSILGEFIQSTALIDLPLLGGDYTWFRGGGSQAASRLDRFLISPEILQAIPQIIQKVLPRSLSDHCPILLKENSNMSKARTFKWFSHWADDKKYRALVEGICSSNNNENICGTLRLIKSASKKWADERRNKDSDSIPVIEERIAVLEAAAISNPGAADASNEIKELRSTLWKKYRTEEREWLQKSRVKYFKEGDRNTKFFHLTTSMRSKVNLISEICVDNSLLTDTEKIKAAFVEFYRSGFNNVNTVPIADFDINVKKLTPLTASKIEEPFTESEIWLAIKAVDGSRAPGLDGFNLDFFKQFWHVLNRVYWSSALIFAKGSCSIRTSIIRI
ncbi:hypothetical protein HRI_005064900 [Hibiscus trionum]|uniref:Endonuclease/exonuclease/phosphatase domain-containing protein n=1 Tax=Hibiscus trionum TaxID=183268 RepID=A0A9W7JEX4_HIBTR|nr:hypothetical protein HRI_005064900 [Hibiscus trionum]